MTPNDKAYISDACGISDYLFDLHKNQTNIMDVVIKELSEKMNKISSELVYILEKVEYQFIRNLLTSLKNNFRSMDLQQITNIHEALLYRSALALKNDDNNGFELDQIIKRVQRCLECLLQCTGMELDRWFSSQLQTRFNAMINRNRHKYHPHMTDHNLPLQYPLHDNMVFDEFDEIMLNGRADDPRLRQVFIFGFSAKMFHPTWRRLFHVQIHSDIIFERLLWRRIAQKQYDRDFVFIDQIKEIPIGHTTETWKKIKNRKLFSNSIFLLRNFLIYYIL
jgi:hypothetical protein